MSIRERNRVLQFNGFELDTGKRELSRGGSAIPLSPKEFTTLQVLVEAHGRAVSRELLMNTVWPDTAVGDTSLARNVSILRRHLGVEAIKSVPKFGYRFEFPVTLQPEPPNQDDQEAPAAPLIVQKSVQFTQRRYATVSLSLAIVLLAGSLLGLKWGRAARQKSVTPRRLAVLPLRNLSSDPARTEAQRDSLAGELTSRLGSLSRQQWRVISEGTTRQYMGTSKSAAEIGSELQADNLLESTVSFDGGHVRLNVTLVNVGDETIAWSRQFSVAPDQVPVVQDKIVEALSAEPPSPGSPTSHTAGLVGTHSPRAHDLYLKGRFELEQRTFDSYQRAEALFQQAAALDENYADAYSGLSEAYIFMGGIIAETECFPKARAAALTALRLDETSAEAHRNLAYVLMNDESMLKESEREYERAIELKPADSRAHHWYAQLLAAERRTGESVREATVGYELDPRSVSSGSNYAFMLTQNDQAQQAQQLLTRLLQREPNNDMTWGYLGFAEVKLGHFAQAAAAFDHAAQHGTLKVNYQACAAYARARGGDLHTARAVLATMRLREQHHQWVPGESMVLLQLALKDRTQALEWLHRGVEDHTVTLFEANTDPIFSEMKDDPRYQQIITSLGG